MANLLLGDCAEQMRTLDNNSIDAIVTDPPYGIAFMGAKWDNFGGKSCGNDSAEEYAAKNTGAPRYANGHGGAPTLDAMRSFQSAMTPIFAEALRVAKPGAHLLAFGGTRTYHRLACAIEDAGWEVRDCIMWVYGSGFPKSMDVSKAIDKAMGAERKSRNGEGAHEGNIDFGMKNRCPKCGKPYFSGNPCTCPREDSIPATPEAAAWNGWGTCLKPAVEPIVVARKPLEGTVAANVLKYGTGAINIDGCRVAYESDADKKSTGMNRPHTSKVGALAGKVENNNERTMFMSKEPQGRFPANLIHDGSDEVLALFPDSKGQCGAVKGTEPSRTGTNGIYGNYNGQNTMLPRGDTGSAARFFKCCRDGEPSADRRYTDNGGTNFAMKPGMRRPAEDTPARFFYCAKASRSERGEGNIHPTVKPLALMRYLVRLVTRKGGTVLDPFMGSGTTGVAAIQEGMEFVGIERDPHYHAIASRRIAEAKPLPPTATQEELPL